MAGRPFFLFGTPSGPKIEAGARAIEKQVGHLDQIKTWGKTIVNNGQNIGDRVDKMHEELTKEVKMLDRQLLASPSAAAS
jgi:hypothetical protein